MKKFFTAIPLQPKEKKPQPGEKAPQPKGLISAAYRAVGNSRLQMEEKTSFPILTAVNGYAQPGEEFRLIAVMPESDDTNHNFEVLCRQFEELCRRKGLSCPKGVEQVFIGASQEVSTYVDTFQKLLDYVDDDDELFSCMTFGTKPQSQAMLLAIQYAYRVKRNASISCIVYGEVDRTRPEPWDIGSVYDMTALVQLDEIIHILAERGVADPKAALNAILTL